MVSSEHIEDDTDDKMDADVDTTASELKSDPDWTRCDQKEKKIPEKFTVVFEQETWFKSIVASVDRAGLSSDNIFFIFSDLFRKHGIDFKDIVMSPTTIAKWRAEAEAEKFGHIKKIHS